MQESKEIGPHITTREELDALYKSIKVTLSEKEKNNVSENPEE